MSRGGRLITIEGIDAAGKDAQTLLLEVWLGKTSHKPVVPGSDVIDANDERRVVHESVTGLVVVQQENLGRRGKRH